MKKIFNFILLIVTIFLILSPLKVRAGIICNDGWESSCSVEAPGCCSHHGGYGESDEDYYNGGNYSSGNNYSNNNNNGAIGGFLIGGVLVALIIIGIFGKEPNNLDEPRTPQQQKNDKANLDKFIKETNEIWQYYNNKDIETIKTLKELKEMEDKVIEKLKEDFNIYSKKIRKFNNEGHGYVEVHNKLYDIKKGLCNLCKINEMLAKLDKRRKPFSYNDYLANLIEEYNILENIIQKRTRY